MKIVRMLGNERLEVIDTPQPEPQEGQAVIKVMASTICGTEYRSWLYNDDSEGAARRFNGGHEVAGVVWETSPGSTLQTGERVTVYASTGPHCGRCVNCLAGVWLRCLELGEYTYDFIGTHSQYILRDERLCFALPDELSFDVGAILMDAVGTPFRAIRRLGVDAFDTVLVTGLGPLGSAASIICHALGARVIASEPNELRRVRAGEYGVGDTIDPASDDALAAVMELTEGRGVDVALDFTGYSEPQLLCLDAARGGGSVGLIGLKYEDGAEGQLGRSTPVRVADQLLLKELTVISSWYVGADEYLQLIELVQRGLPVERLITHRFGIDDSQEAFETSFGGRGTKVIIHPWAE